MQVFFEHFRTVILHEDIYECRASEASQIAVVTMRGGMWRTEKLHNIIMCSTATLLSLLVCHT